MQSSQNIHPTRRGPKIDPKTENHTAKERAVALNLFDATNDAAYLDCKVADWPIPSTNAPTNNKANESIKRLVNRIHTANCTYCKSCTQCMNS